MPQDKEEEDPPVKVVLKQLNPLDREEDGDKTRAEWGGDKEEAETFVHNEGSELLTPELLNDILGSEKDTQCGLEVLHGGCLQRLANPLTYLLLSSVVALVQGIFYTYANATLSTVEKRFHLPSKISGFVTTGNDLIQLALAIPVTFMAGRGHRPRWLALGMFGAVLACILAATPHFIFGEGYNAGQTDGNTTKHSHTKMLCADVSDDNVTICDDKDASQSYNIQQYTVITLHIIAQMLAGMASLLYYSIGYTYMDEAVSKAKIPFFLAVSGSVRILGPVCGYSLAAWCLSMWVNPSHIPTLHPRHPHWIGAWWIGYLIIGSCLLLVSWSLALMPKTLPGARRRALKELTHAAQRGGMQAMQSLARTFRPANTKGCQGMLGSLRRLVNNRVFLMVCLNQVFFWFAFFGYITFKPKFLEHQFKMSASRANQYIAGAALAATLAGWLVTGAGLTLLRPRTKHVLSFMALLSLINCVLHLCMVNISCNHDKIHGMDMVLYERAHSSHNTTQLQTSDVGIVGECSVGCGCGGQFSPVCVMGTYNFYSGCHAGCSSQTNTGKTKVYENCTCAPLINNSSLSAEDSTADEGVESAVKWSAVDGFCNHECPTFYMYLTLTVLTKMTNAASRVPLNIILFRCVEERDKDLGLGVFNAVLALGSSIPAPIIFGWAIDHSCRLWETTCGKQGFCWLYDIESFRRILHGIPAGLMLCCLITELILLTMHKSINLYGAVDTPSSSSIHKSFPQSSTKTSIVNKEEADKNS